MMIKIGVAFLMAVLPVVSVQAAYVSSSRISRICDTTSYNLKEQSAQFDYDGNGELGIADVIISLRVASGIYKKESYIGKIFDLDGSGTVTSSDARILLVCRDAFLSRIEQQQTQGGVQTAFRPSVEKIKDIPTSTTPPPAQQQQPPASAPQSYSSSPASTQSPSSNTIAYRITSGPCEGHDYKQVQHYDYNNDGFIDQYDEMILQDTIAGKRKISDFSQKMIDINQDGTVNQHDSALFNGCGVSSMIEKPSPIAPGEPIIKNGYCQGRVLKDLIAYDYTNDGVVDEKDSDVMIERLATQRAQGAEEKKKFDINGDGYESFEDIRLQMICAMPYEIKAREMPILKDVQAFVCSGKKVSEQEKKTLIQAYDVTRDTIINGYDVYTILGVVVAGRSEYALKMSAQALAEEKKNTAQFDINRDGIVDAKDVAFLARCSIIDH
ncbi:MAG TPA: dockerin type I domain-containing protein [Patescibacteria group bacterium]|nr:dockerin type I domain-containing protein [Patescibacteria group bacterium]